MKKQTWLWQLMGFAVTSFLGTVLHFLYDWLNKSALIAPFSSVNESTWEHMKLLFWPMLAYAAVQSLFFRDREDFWCIKLRGILLGLALIPVIFYTYNGVIGKSADWINIAIFFVSAAAAYVYEGLKLKGAVNACRTKWLAIAVLIAIALLFVLFTFNAPNIGIFANPLVNA